MKLQIFFMILSMTFATPLNYIAEWPQKTSDPIPLYNENVSAGPLRQKAEKYDWWNAKYHHPYYGGLATVIFSDTTYTKPISYEGVGDSCIWTGTYLGIQA